MDNYQHLYNGSDGWEDWATTFERNSAVRRSVVIRETADGSVDVEVNNKYDDQMHLTSIYLTSVF